MTLVEKFEIELKKPGFRGWLNDRWLEHKDEVLKYTGQPCDYDLGVYFNKYKWWLKKLYKEQHKNVR